MSSTLAASASWKRSLGKVCPKTVSEDLLRERRSNLSAFPWCIALFSLLTRRRVPTRKRCNERPTPPKTSAWPVVTFWSDPQIGEVPFDNNNL